MNWHASWIWHPPVERMENFYLYARRELVLDRVPQRVRLFVTANSLYQLFINGRPIGRGPNPSDPSFHYYDVYDVAEHLRSGPNVIAAVCYSYCETPRGIIGQNWGRGGFLLEMRADGDERALLVTDGSWRVVQAPEWDQDAPINCTLYADHKETYDSRKQIAGWTDAGFDDRSWHRPLVIGPPPVEPWTRLVEREIPPLGGERVFPVNAYWESASVTYAWRDDWEVYHEQKLVPGARKVPAEKWPRVFKTHEDFTPSVLLDFGRDVTGYPEIHVRSSAGGIIDVLYGEDLFLVRVDRFILKGGEQVLRPFNRRTFRYMKLQFPQTPEPIEIAEASMEMNTYPVEPRGTFSCSDDLLNRIWDVGAYTMRLCMLDHFCDCPWRERTIYGGDVYPENLIAYYAFGDPRLDRKTLRQMFAIQYPQGALPPYGPYRGCDSFYPAWSAYFGLTFIDHYWLTADPDFLDELWPGFVRLCKWAIDQIERNEPHLIGTPAKGCKFDEWMASPKVRFSPTDNLPFYAMLKRGAELARLVGRNDAERLQEAADRMSAAIRSHLIDSGTHLARGMKRDPNQRARQYDNGLLLWSGLPDGHDARGVAHRLLDGGMFGIDHPFHGFFVVEGLYGYGEDKPAMDFIRRYWGDMLRRGATTFWESFSLDWPPSDQPGRGQSLCHAWSAGPTYSLPAHVLGVRPLEPGFRRIRIAPQPADLSWAAGRVPTPHGAVEVRWQRTEGRFELEAVIPPGTEAEVLIPSSSRAAEQPVPTRIGPGRTILTS